MAEILQLVTKPEQINTDIQNLFKELSEKLSTDDVEEKLTFKKACVLLLDDEDNGTQVDHYDFTMISANLATSELISLLEIAKHRAFNMNEGE